MSSAPPKVTRISQRKTASGGGNVPQKMWMPMVKAAPRLQRAAKVKVPLLLKRERLKKVHPTLQIKERVPVPEKFQVELYPPLFRRLLAQKTVEVGKNRYPFGTAAAARHRQLIPPLVRRLI